MLVNLITPSAVLPVSLPNSLSFPFISHGYTGPDSCSTASSVGLPPARARGCSDDPDIRIKTLRLSWIVSSEREKRAKVGRGEDGAKMT